MAQPLQKTLFKRSRLKQHNKVYFFFPSVHQTNLDRKRLSITLHPRREKLV